MSGKLPIFLLIAALPAIAPPPSAAAEQGQLDASPALFSVLAAINASGYDAGIDTAANHPLREAVRKHVAAHKPPVLDDLKRFYRDHKQKTADADLGQYVSFALSVLEPPEFQSRFRQNEVPPDVQRLEGFAALMKRFHQEAAMDDLWAKAQPAFEQMIGRYHAPVSRALLMVNGYLRNVTSGYLGRRFQIYIDLMGAPDQVLTRSYGDDYFVVVTPDCSKEALAQPPDTDEIRHAYLHHLLDPLVFKYAEPLEKKKSLIDFALGAPLLGDSFKNDFVLLTTESLIKAVEARMVEGDFTRRQSLLDQATREGYILTPFFAEQLPVYEKQETAMRLYFPDMANAIDLKKETRRLDQVQFASTRPPRKALPRAEPPAPEGAAKTLAGAEDLYVKRDLENARKSFLGALHETDVKSLHAKAYYGLARIATLQNDPELAERLFRKTLELEPDPAEKAWSLVYLGRLSDMAGEHAQAVENYKSALSVQGASDMAREQAEKGLRGAFRKGNQ